MNKLHRSRYINVVVSMMMAFLMLAAMGTTQVHAAQYTTGTIDPAELKAGDVVYRGVQLTVDRQIVVCKKCNMIWITTGTDYGTGDTKRSEVVATEAIRIIRIRWDIASLTGILILTAPAHC